MQRVVRLGLLGWPLLTLLGCTGFAPRPSNLGGVQVARETFGKLFFESFGVPLDRANPLQCGRRAGLDGEAQNALERLEPVRWPRAERAGELARSARSVCIFVFVEVLTEIDA